MPIIMGGWLGGFDEVGVRIDKMGLAVSVTSKKSPNVYKNCPKMISIEN